MRGKHTIIGIAVAAAAALSGAAPASAAPICRVVDTSGPTPPAVTVCFDARQSGTTVAPYVETTLCVGYICGTNEWVNLGRTGVSGGAIPGLSIDPATLSVRFSGGTVATVWVDGASYPVSVPGFCVGDPSYCDSLLTP